jgi:opacity protein-like surface antigen
MGRPWMLSLSVILALALSAADAFSQNQAQPQTQNQAQGETRVGCLMNGRTTGTFVLVDEITGARLDVVGTNLGRFTETGGSRVTLTGSVVRQGTTDVFQVTAAEQNRELCAPIAYSAESQKFELGKARLGIRGGLGLDPELVMVGAQVQLGPIFKQIWLRPTAEFGFGEVSKIFSLNADLAYYLPFAGVGKDSKTRYNVYVGGGPAYTLARRDFEGFPDQPVEDVDSDWESEFGLNLIFGVAQSSGWFAELRASAYNSPAVRLYVGYVFR